MNLACGATYEFDEQQCLAPWRIEKLLLFMIIFQSVGVRFFQFQGAMLSLITIALLLPGFNITVKQFAPIYLCSLLIVVMSWQSEASFESLVYFALILIIAILFTRRIRSWPRVENELHSISWWISFHGLVGYLIYLMFPGLFQPITFGWLDYNYFGIFVNSNGSAVRATGLCWEPGLLQYFGNVSLFLGLKQSRHPLRLLISLLTVVVTYSTTGILILLPITAYAIARQRSLVTKLATCCFLLILMGGLYVSVFKSNVATKLSGTNTSGLIRQRDYLVGVDLIKQKPLLGHGLVDSEYINERSANGKIEKDLLGEDYVAGFGYMSGGYTNGFLAIIVSYGIFIGGYMYLCFYNNAVVQGGQRERLTFFVISIAAFFAEPVTMTSLFFIFVISGLPQYGISQFIFRISRLQAS